MTRTLPRLLEATAEAVEAIRTAVTKVVTGKPRFFLTPAAKKTKTQAENSKKESQPQGGNFLLSRKLKEKTSILNFSTETENIYGLDLFLYAIFITKYCQNRNI